ncbi:hypothetical protein MHBO_004544, partial [Bonamia ostreae]
MLPFIDVKDLEPQELILWITPTKTLHMGRVTSVDTKNALIEVHYQGTPDPTKLEDQLFLPGWHPQTYQPTRELSSIQHQTFRPRNYSAELCTVAASEVLATGLRLNGCNQLAPNSLHRVLKAIASHTPATVRTISNFARGRTEPPHSQGQLSPLGIQFWGGCSLSEYVEDHILHEEPQEENFNEVTIRGATFKAVGRNNINKKYFAEYGIKSKELQIKGSNQLPATKNE